jgi:hypothetical protein
MKLLLQPRACVLLARGPFSILTSKEFNLPPSGPKKPWSLPLASTQNPQT